MAKNRKGERQDHPIGVYLTPLYWLRLRAAGQVLAELNEIPDHGRKTPKLPLSRVIGWLIDATLEGRETGEIAAAVQRHWAAQYAAEVATWAHPKGGAGHYKQVSLSPGRRYRGRVEPFKERWGKKAFNHALMRALDELLYTAAAKEQAA